MLLPKTKRTIMLPITCSQLLCMNMLVRTFAQAGTASWIDHGCQ
jgi:hypothetical protein